MNFGSVVNQVLILFLLMIIGYTARKLKVFNGEVTAGLSAILLNLTTPALIISSMQESYTPDLLIESMQILGLSLGIYVFSFLFGFLVPYLLHPNPREKGAFHFMMMFTNSGYMGYPVLQSLLGNKGLFYGIVYNLPFNLLAFTIGIMMLRKGRDTENTFDPKILLNPGVTSVLVGFILFIFSIKLPAPIKGSLEMLGNVTIPLSMIVIGAILSNFDVKEIFLNWKLYVISFLRLIVLPLLVYVILKPFIHEGLLLSVPVIITAMPVATIAAILAEEYCDDAKVESQGVFISTLFSLITIPIIAMLFV